MDSLEIALPATATPAYIRRALKTACAQAGLRQTLRGTLRAYPGCTHWHYKRGRERGVLEITYWPSQQRAWFKIAAGRQGEWMAAGMRQIQASVAAQLGAPAS